MGRRLLIDGQFAGRVEDGESWRARPAGRPGGRAYGSVETVVGCTLDVAGVG